MLLAGNSTSPVCFRRRRTVRLPLLSKSSANCCPKPSSGSSNKNKNKARAEPIRPRIKVITGKPHHPPVRIPPRTSPAGRQRGLPQPQDQVERLSKVERLLGTANATKSEGFTETTTTESCQNELTIAVPRPIFMLLRAYKRRKRHGPGLSRLDTESGSGVWREGDWDNHVRNGRLTRDSRQLQGRMPSDRDDVVRIPEPTVPRDSEPSWNARDIVGEGFRREEDQMAAKRTVNVRRGYEIDTAEERGHSVHAAENSLRVAPSIHSQTSSIGKIERMTGNKLSNDLYEDRPSGQGHPREGRDSVATTAPHQPRINTSIPPASMFDSYTVNADLSPASTIGSWAFGISSPVACTPLNPPPAPSPSQIAATYPNIAALARVNVTVSSKAAPKRQSSFLAREPSIAEHIASQFSHSRHKRLSNSSSTTRGSSSTRKLAPPLSAARGGFTGLTRYDSKASQKSHTSSISTFRHGTLEEEEEPPPRPILLSAPPPPRSRAPSWSGRSVLVLDDEPRKPNSRTTLSPPASGTSTGNFLGFMEHGGGEGIQRSASISKASVSSVPSSISSFSTVYAGIPGGLSPTPALRRPRIPRTTDDTSPVSETASSMTEAELEANKYRVRERVRRGSQERETGRKKDEEEDEFQPARTSFGFL